MSNLTNVRLRTNQIHSLSKSFLSLLSICLPRSSPLSPHLTLLISLITQLSVPLSNSSCPNLLPFSNKTLKIPKCKFPLKNHPSLDLGIQLAVEFKPWTQVKLRAVLKISLNLKDQQNIHRSIQNYFGYILPRSHFL